MKTSIGLHNTVFGFVLTFGCLTDGRRSLVKNGNDTGLTDLSSVDYKEPELITKNEEPAP